MYGMVWYACNCNMQTRRSKDVILVEDGVAKVNEASQRSGFIVEYIEGANKIKPGAIGQGLSSNYGRANITVLDLDLEPQS